ncbi:YicC family protein [bacterium]|nr:YicC family protein [bacterium]
MITSMTGQGRAVSVIKPEGLRITVEARSVNHRYLDVAVKLPDQLAAFEDDIKQIVKQEIARGSINISVHIEESNGKHLTIDTQVLDEFTRILRELKKKMPVSGELSPEILFRLPGLIKEKPRDVDPSKIWKSVETLTRKALMDLVKMRKSEGRNLEADLKKRLSAIMKNLAAIKKRVPGRIREKKAKLIELIEGMQLEADRNRLLQEVLYFSERFDIHEECVRLENHARLFRETLNEKMSNGRRLNFTAQEMMKETNTIGSKANDTEITHFVISIKEEVEKMREQVQNVE